MVLSIINHSLVPSSLYRISIAFARAPVSLLLFSQIYGTFQVIPRRLLSGGWIRPIGGMHYQFNGCHIHGSDTASCLPRSMHRNLLVHIQVSFRLWIDRLSTERSFSLILSQLLPWRFCHLFLVRFSIAFKCPPPLV